MSSRADAALALQQLVDAVASGPTTMTQDDVRRMSVFTQRYPSFPAAIVGVPREEVEKIQFLLTSFTRRELFCEGRERSRAIEVMWRCARKHGRDFETAMRILVAKRFYGVPYLAIVSWPHVEVWTVALHTAGSDEEEGGGAEVRYFIETEDSDGSPFAEERVMAAMARAHTILLSPGDYRAQIAEILAWPPLEGVHHRHHPGAMIFHRKGRGWVAIDGERRVRIMADASTTAVTVEMPCKEEEEKF